jgi:hypothetical protein
MGYYGVDIDPSNAKTFKHSRIVPKNAVIFEMTQPDGVKRIFQRDFDDESILLGDNPWIGEEQNNRITIMTNPEFKKGQTGFLFDKGWLRLMLLNGKQYKINKIPFNVSTNTVQSLWKRESLIKQMGVDDKYKIWRNDGRLRLWFENPNKAGAFLTGMAFLSLLLCLRRYRFLKVLGLLLFFTFLFGVVQTSSRGALLGCLVGIGVILLSFTKKYFTYKNSTAF